MKDHGRALLVGLALVGGVLVAAWWWGSTPGGPHRGLPPPATLARGVFPGPPRTSLAPATATTLADPAEGWATPAGALGTAEAFARALLSVPTGAPASAAVARCQDLTTPGFLAKLASSPGAPALAGVAEPVVVTGVTGALDDWAAGSAGVAVGVSLHAGTDGPPSFLGMDVHVVADAGTWRVDGMQL